MSKIKDLELTSLGRLNAKKQIEDLFSYQAILSQYQTSGSLHKNFGTIEVSPSLFEKESQLSDSQIMEFRLIAENWRSITQVPSQVIEVDNEVVTLECLIDLEENLFEYKNFDIELFERLTPLKQFMPIMITIYKRPGEVRHKIDKGDDLFDPNIFNGDYYSNISPEIFSQKL